jgi:hypothetical protein
MRILHSRKPVFLPRGVQQASVFTLRTGMGSKLHRTLRRRRALYRHSTGVADPREMKTSSDRDRSPRPGGRSEISQRCGFNEINHLQSWRKVVSFQGTISIVPIAAINEDGF